MIYISGRPSFYILAVVSGRQKKRTIFREGKGRKKATRKHIYGGSGMKIDEGILSGKL